MGNAHAAALGVTGADPDKGLECLDGVTPEQAQQAKAMVEEFYKSVGLEPEVIANAVLYAVSQPDNVDVSDLGVRPSMES